MMPFVGSSIIYPLSQLTINFSDCRALYPSRTFDAIDHLGKGSVGTRYFYIHFHMLIVPQRDMLARFMRWLLTGYVVTFNRRHNQTWHLFRTAINRSSAK